MASYGAVSQPSSIELVGDAALDSELAERSEPGTDISGWALAVTGNQVLRITATGTERIDMVTGAALLATNAMRLESIVQLMEQSGRWKEARVSHRILHGQLERG
ncbi:hypothetical protein [Xanthomonas sp. WHRI 10204]|uniref:hypothetical protein n=1 Tax=Xanthomonas sp. WHRI 10204 TaxID=3161562 RepID=UPI0032E89C71